MNTTKATYWIAVGALALGLNSEYQLGKLPAVRRVADRAGFALCQLAARAERTVAMARLVIGERAIPAADSFTSTEEMAQARAETLQDQARDRAEMVRDQVRAHAEIVRAQAEMRRAQMEQIRVSIPRLELSRAMNRRLVIADPSRCLKQSVRVSISDRNALVDLSGDGDDDSSF